MQPWRRIFIISTLACCAVLGVAGIAIAIVATQTSDSDPNPNNASTTQDDVAVYNQISMPLLMYVDAPSPPPAPPYPPPPNPPPYG